MKVNGIELVYYDKFDFELPEESELLMENSRSKAEAVAKKYNCMAMGDDSGIFIEELNWFPGVHSRRWLGVNKTDLERSKEILELMKGKQNRKVYLISNFSIVKPDGELFFETSVKNEFILSKEIKGNGGFGYDNILIPTRELIVNALFEGRISSCELAGIVNKSVAELTQNQKNAINNRGRIASEISDFLLLKNNSQLTENYRKEETDEKI